jgi:peptide/nickel transport system ATP-binding protein
MTTKQKTASKKSPVSEIGIDVKDLKVHYDTPDGVVKAVDGVSFSLRQGERMALVGESGSGKSTLAMALMRLTRAPGRIAGGQVLVGDQDLLDLDEEEMRLQRLNEVALVPQGAMNSLNPVMKIKNQILDGLYDHQVSRDEKMSKEEQIQVVERLLLAVDLAPGVAEMYPHELSGGMKQRVAIAIATSMEPRIIVADEPTSALDVVVQRNVMQTLGRLQEGLHASIILIGHDMGLVAQFSDHVGVMYAGRLVEVGPVKTVFKSPKHPYTRLLIKSLPTLSNKTDFIGIPGLPATLLNLPEGCAFCLRIGKTNPNLIPWVKVEKDHFIQDCKNCASYGN